MIIFSFVIFFLIVANAYGQDMFLIPLGYDFIRIGKQTVHQPAIGAGFMLGERDLPFTEVERRFLGLAIYQPSFWKEEPLPEIPKQLHYAVFIFDGRISRHQFLLIFNSASDKPVAGGLHTFQAGAGYGYEIIRQHHISLILGFAVGVSDFGIDLPSGAAWPVLPLPLIRLGVDTQWFVSSFDFLAGPNFSFTVAPKEKIRLTGDMRMDYYRSIGDIICEYVLWYRFFDAEHKMGDFAGIGIGFKNDSFGFAISHNEELFEFRQTSAFAAIDLTLIKLQAGRIFDSRYLVDGEKIGSPGRGFFVSVQGMVPIKGGN